MQIKGFIKNDGEWEEMLALIEKVMMKEMKEMTEEEERLYLLCCHLVEVYEGGQEEASPLNVLLHLAEAHGKALGHFSNLMNDCSMAPLKGERPFSEAEAACLADYFRVSKETFLEGHNDIHD